MCWDKVQGEITAKKDQKGQSGRRGSNEPGVECSLLKYGLVSTRNPACKSAWEGGAAARGVDKKPGRTTLDRNARAPLEREVQQLVSA